jgi:hypothetical protein
MHSIKRNRNLAALQDILDITALGGFLYGTLNQRLGATQETLAVFQALAARIQTPIDNEHRHQCLLSEVRVTLQRPPFTNLGKSWALANLRFQCHFLFDVPASNSPLAARRNVK